VLRRKIIDDALAADRELHLVALGCERPDQRNFRSSHDRDVFNGRAFVQQRGSASIRRTRRLDVYLVGQHRIRHC
jgi:hypothetical protein